MRFIHRVGGGNTLPYPTPYELPPPPVSETDWPWMGEIKKLPDAMPDGSPWPLVSIITPSYNQALFLEKSIRSVLLQAYPNLEYIIIDGGSTDGSVEIIRKYEPWLAYWVSEPDHGQAEAINKGFRRASGQIAAWLNSDDIYLPGAIPHAVRALQSSTAAAVYSRCRMVTPEGQVTAIYDPFVPISLRSLVLLWKHPYPSPPQPAVFFHRKILGQVGLLDESLHYALDYELWLRICQHATFLFVDAVWADYVVHPQSKTGKGWEPFMREAFQVGRRYWHHLSLVDHMNCRLFGWRAILGRRYLAQAVDSYYENNWSEVGRFLVLALRSDPTRLFAPAVLSLCAKYCSRIWCARKDRPLQRL